MAQQAAAVPTGLHGGCRTISTAGTEQHSRHRHIHVVASTTGVRLERRL